ncbi:hypothetical protein GGS24DRAFT_223308 [Hypoxylon argillaceum]|nr:hypothetical protein GGS24DRAFT_223308 [Hypoxylon argillaceum]
MSLTTTMSLPSAHAPAALEMAALPLPASAQPATGQTSSFCQAIMFFHTCGCRTPEPVYCCQPPAGFSSTTNPCKHETPAIVVAKLPHACGRKIGSSEACGAEDPGAKEFVREVDTAERLELAVLGGLKKEGVESALPGRVSGEFTVGEVVSRSWGDGKSKVKRAFSAMAKPFVPGLGAYVPALATMIEEISSVDHGEEIETIEDVFVNHVTVVDGADTVGAGITEADGVEQVTAEASTVEVSVDEVSTNGAGQPDQQEDKSEAQHNDAVLVEENGFEEVALDIGLKVHDSNSDEDFDDLALPELTSEKVADDEKPQQPNSLTAEPTAKQEERGPDAAMLDPNSDSSYGDMTAVWASETKTEVKNTRTCYGNVSALIGAWLRGGR